MEDGVDFILLGGDALPIKRSHAIGEVAGDIHGNNRRHGVGDMRGKHGLGVGVVASQCCCSHAGVAVDATCIQESLKMPSTPSISSSSTTTHGLGLWSLCAAGSNRLWSFGWKPVSTLGWKPAQEFLASLHSWANSALPDGIFS